MFLRISLYLYFITSVISNCSGQHVDTYPSDQIIPFYINQPDKTYNLVFELAEVSGLEYSDGQLLAIQDELGVIYQLDTSTGKILNKIPIAGPDDFEGVAMDEDHYYMITSEGLIFQRNKGLKEKTKIIDSDLPFTGDFEALEYDEDTNTLLAVTKGNSKGELYPGKNRYIFSVDLSQNNTSKILLELDYGDIKKYLRVENDTIHYMNVNRAYKKPKPSGLAIDPISNQFYLLHDSGKLLIVYSRTGSIQGVAFLNPSVHPKPEGIIFDDQGHMYISNEQETGPATLHKIYRKDGN
jgi:uncharacterized protein YjiK